MTPFHGTSKAEFFVVKIPCVLKIFSKPRRVKKSRANGVAHCHTLQHAEAMAAM